MAVPAGRTSPDIILGYRDAIAESDEILSGFNNPESLTARAVDDAPKSLRCRESSVIPNRCMTRPDLTSAGSKVLTTCVNPSSVD
jgi:hypothetical protein